MECPTCYLDSCDRQIHQATLSIRKWFRQDLLRRLEPTKIHKPQPRPKAFTNQPVLKFSRRRAGIQGERNML